MAIIRGNGYDEHAGLWRVSEQYNAAVDAMDFHERSSLAMIWCDYTGKTRLVSWGELRDRSNQFARMLLQRGIRPGDVVAVLLPQIPEAAAAYAGCLRIGAVLLAMSTVWSSEQIASRLDRTEAHALITDQQSVANLGVPTPSDLMVVLVDIDTLDGHSARQITIATKANDPALVYFTSGTAGPAKVLLHAQRNLIGHNEFEVSHDIRRGDVFYAGGEWAWSHAKLFGPWRYGAVQLVYRQEREFDPDGLLRAISRHHVSSALLNPTLVKAIRRQASTSVIGLPWHFRTVCSSNEPLDPQLNEWFEEAFGCPIREYYGLTESYPIIGYRADEVIVRGSTGKPMPGWQVELDPLAEESDLADGSATGELLLKANGTPQYPLGYLGDPAASSAAFGGEWFRTGDTFTRSEDGYWFFRARNDDLIKTSGYRVGPAEIEEILQSHQAVREAAVVGLPDPDRGQAVCAFIVPENRISIDQVELVRELQDLVRARHSRIAYPRSIVFVDHLPRSSTGKVQRAQLRRSAYQASFERTN